MYFNNIPNIQYDTKPISYPFSNSDYVVAKNFFRRYQVNPDVFSYATFFKRYSIQDGERLDVIANNAYGDPFLDWVIALTNNMINPLFDMPMTDYELRKWVESSYDNPYEEIKHYETYEFKNSAGNIILKSGVIVDETFYNRPYKYWDAGEVKQIPGNQLCTPVTVFEYEEKENEKRREIYLLKPEFLEPFMTDFRKTNLYIESTDYINSKLKKTGV